MVANLSVAASGRPGRARPGWDDAGPAANKTAIAAVAAAARAVNVILNSSNETRGLESADTEPSVNGMSRIGV